MHKIKNKENGVTLIALIITIMALSILIAITVEFGLSTVKEVENDQIESELSLVQSAIIQQYTLLITQNQSGEIADTIKRNAKLEDDINRPKCLIGTRLSSIDMITKNGFSDYKIDKEILRCLKMFYLLYFDIYYFGRKI